MSKELEKINSFLEEHHVMSLATTHADEMSVCSLVYTLHLETTSFIVASSEDTTDIQHIKHNQNVAGNILLETKNIGKIEGVQFRGTFSALQEERLKALYFQKFPHARIMNPKLWQIQVNSFKMTDNTLGFGKKIIWKKPFL